jgi:serine/threonine protein kinase
MELTTLKTVKDIRNVTSAFNLYDFSFEEAIGESNHKVYEAKSKEDGLSYALKSSHYRENSGIEKEILVLWNLDHENIVKVHDAFIVKTKKTASIYFAMDLAICKDISGNQV